jgi:hypothetical protein
MTDMLSADQAGDKQSRKGFRKGQSGNPAGRPKGVRLKTSYILENLARPEAGNLARKLIDMALAGNERALLAIKDYLWPNQRGRSIELDLGIICDTGTALSGLTKIITAMSTGDVTPDEASSLAIPLEKFLRATEIVDLEARVAALEKDHAQ